MRTCFGVPHTKKSVSDKVACLLSITPDLLLTPDKGIIECKNGLT